MTEINGSRGGFATIRAMQYAMKPGPSPAESRDQRLIEGVVSNLGFCWGLTPAQNTGMARHCRTLSARRGEVVAHRDARLPGVLALGYGSVKLALRGADGEERVLRLVSAGQTFGAATALLGRPCRYDALALVESRLVVIPSAAIFACMDHDPRFARRMVLSLAEGKLELLGELEAATLQRSAQRLASFLDALAEPDETGGAFLVKLPVSKTVVAARLGVKKETLSRLLRQFSVDGLIQVSRREVSILDRERLAGIARSNGVVL